MLTAVIVRPANTNTKKNQKYMVMNVKLNIIIPIPDSVANIDASNVIDKINNKSKIPIIIAISIVSILTKYTPR